MLSNFFTRGDCDMTNAEKTVNNILNTMGFFFSSQSWFIALKSIISVAITTIEVASSDGKVEKANKKAEAIKQINRSCEQLGLYKLINKNIVMTFAGPVIDTIIWALNTFVPGWDKELINEKVQTNN